MFVLALTVSPCRAATNESISFESLKGQWRVTKYVHADGSITTPKDMGYIETYNFDITAGQGIYHAHSRRGFFSKEDRGHTEYRFKYDPSEARLLMGTLLGVRGSTTNLNYTVALMTFQVRPSNDHLVLLYMSSDLCTATETVQAKQPFREMWLKKQ